MKIKLLTGVLTAAAAAVVLYPQQVRIGVESGQRPAIAIPDMRGAGDAQKFMTVFNETLWNEVQTSGLFKMTPKSLYPLAVPQQPSDFKPPVGGRSAGPWLSDWQARPFPHNGWPSGTRLSAITNWFFLDGFST